MLTFSILASMPLYFLITIHTIATVIHSIHMQYYIHPLIHRSNQYDSFLKGKAQLIFCLLQRETVTHGIQYSRTN